MGGMVMRPPEDFGLTAEEMAEQVALSEELLAEVVAKEREERIAAAVRVMLDLSPVDLTEALATIRRERCLYCGSYDPRCYCVRDE